MDGCWYKKIKYRFCVYLASCKIILISYFMKVCIVLLTLPGRWFNHLQIMAVLYSSFSSFFPFLVVLSTLDYIYRYTDSTEPVAPMVKCMPAIQETQARSLSWEDPLEKEMATHSSTLAWKIPWTEEPCRLQPMGSQRVGHDWVTSHVCACR